MGAVIARNLLLRAELTRSLHALNEAGIDTLVLKGLPLVHRLYGRLDGRPIGDNDLLVRKKDAASACDVLATLGYEAPPFRELEPQLRVDKAFTMVRRGPGGVPVAADLHWTAFPPHLFPVPESLLWKRTDAFEIDDLRARVFDRPLTIVHLASHFVQHRFAEPRILRDLGRAWDLWHRDVDLPELLSLARETGLLAGLDYSLGAARELGFAETPAPETGSREAALLRRLLSPPRLLEPRPKRDYPRELFRLVLVSPRRYPGWLRQLFFPPIENMAAIHQRPVGPSLYLRYATRPFRPLWRMLGGRADPNP